MPLLIQTNVASLQSQKNLNASQLQLAKSYNKLSSGFRINTAADDAAGLAISESMRAQIRSFTVAERNANDAISMAQTAEGAFGEVSNILVRMRELAMQGANGSLGSVDRDYLNTEFSQLQDEIDRIQASTKFNGTPLLDTAPLDITFQVGLQNLPTDQIVLNFGGLDLSAVGSASVAGADTSASLGALDLVDSALGIISTQRAKYGAAMNRLEITTANLQTMRLNLSAANSRIRDVDVAEETSFMARQQVLTQAGAAILAQANQIPALAMSLLK